MPRRPAFEPERRGAARLRPRRGCRARPAAGSGRGCAWRCWYCWCCVLIGLVLPYSQVRAVAAQVVVRDARLNLPVASPLVGFNPLVIGVDARADHPEEGVRGDTLILVHMDPAGRWASTLSIPRDTQVSLRDDGETKINVAYGQGYARAEELFGPGTSPEQGGMAMAAETVEQFLDLPSHNQRVDYVATINFDGFAKIIDALGGITVRCAQADRRRGVPDARPRHHAGRVRAGRAATDGERALIYARTRHADDDFGRAARQQQVIRAIADEIRGRSLPGKLALIPRLREGLNGSVATHAAARPTSTPWPGWADWPAASTPRHQPDPPGTRDRAKLPGDRLEPDLGYWAMRALSSIAFHATPLRGQARSATVQVLNGTEIGGWPRARAWSSRRPASRSSPAGNAPASDNLEDGGLRPDGQAGGTSRSMADQLGADLLPGPLPEGATSDADIVVPCWGWMRGIRLVIDDGNW